MDGVPAPGAKILCAILKLSQDRRGGHVPAILSDDEGGHPDYVGGGHTGAVCPIPTPADGDQDTIKNPFGTEKEGGAGRGAWVLHPRAFGPEIPPGGGYIDDGPSVVAV